MKDLWENHIIHRILAVAVLTALLGFSPNVHQVERALILANRDRTLKDFSSVSHNLATAAEKTPWLSNLWEPAGHYALEGGVPEQAIHYFKHAAAAGILSPEGYFEFADAYLAIGNPFTAIQIWSAGNQIYGPSVLSLDRIATQQRGLKDYPNLINTLKARLIIEQTGSASPETISNLNYELGLILSSVDPNTAPPYLLQAADINPGLTAAARLAYAIQRAIPNDNPAYTLMTSGRALASLGMWDLAAYAFQNVTQTHPEYSDAWAYLGEAQQHQIGSDPKNAFQALQTAIDLDPTSLPANVYLAVYWQRNGYPERAHTYLTTALQLAPNNPDLLVDLGTVTAVLGDLDTAMTYYTKAIELTEGNPEFIRKFGDFCIRFNYHIEDVALPLARQGLITAPHDPRTLDLMGQVLFRMGDALNAKRFLLRAITEDPDYPPAYLHIGLVHEFQGEPALAAQAFLKAISLAPETPTAALATRFLEDLNLP